MRQRVGIARAFALEPKVLLLDEPFSLLAVVTCLELLDELMRLCASERKSVLMVTHDVYEALLLADRIVMMTNGPAATVGEIMSVPFERPRDRMALADDSRYHALRSQLLSFLEERAERGQAPAAARRQRQGEKAESTVTRKNYSWSRNLPASIASAQGFANRGPSASAVEGLRRAQTILGD